MSPVRPLHPNDLPELRQLFRSFPYKEAQHRFQGIDPDTLADFFTNAERTRLEAGGANGRWVAIQGGSVVGLGGLQGDDWHSKFYPYRFGRIAPLLVHQAPASAAAELLDTLVTHGREKQYTLLSARIDGSEHNLLRLMQSRGFYLVDCSVKLSASIAKIPSLAPPSRAGGMRIREFDPADLAAVKKIAATSHSVNHFNNDPHLDRPKTNALFEAWVEKCCLGTSSIVFVIEHRNKVCGFVIYLNPAGLNKALRTHLVILDFVCLSPEARGGGVGSWLISQTVRRMAKTFTMVELRTSQNNYAALGCYESLGMHTIGSDFIVHSVAS